MTIRDEALRVVVDAAVKVADAGSHCTCMSPMAKGCGPCDSRDELVAAVELWRKEAPTESDDRKNRGDAATAGAVEQSAAVPAREAQ